MVLENFSLSLSLYIYKGISKFFYLFCNYSHLHIGTKYLVQIYYKVLLYIYIITPSAVEIIKKTMSIKEVIESVTLYTI